MRFLITIGLSLLVQGISAPTFIGICGAKDNPGTCILIRAGIVLVVFISLNILIGKSK